MSNVELFSSSVWPTNVSIKVVLQYLLMSHINFQKITFYFQSGLVIHFIVDL